MNDKELRAIILALLQNVKDDHDYCSTLGNEIAALRDALQELSGGKFLPILERHRARMWGIAAELKAHDSSVIDDLIRRLLNSEGN
jgi:hypothetical protein